MSRDDALGSIESVKAVAELVIPVGGEVVSVNAALEDAHDFVTRAPHEKVRSHCIAPSSYPEIENSTSSCLKDDAGRNKWRLWYYFGMRLKNV